MSQQNEIKLSHTHTHTHTHTYARIKEKNLTDRQRDHRFSGIRLDHEALHDGSYGIVGVPRDIRRFHVPSIAKNLCRHLEFENFKSLDTSKFAVSSNIPCVPAGMNFNRRFSYRERIGR